MTYTIPDFGPSDLLTSQREGTRRLRVDIAQTGFFEGREVRTFIEYSILSGQSLVIRATVPINTILFGISVTLDQSKIRISTKVGGTAGGTWAPMPVIRKNNMTTAPTYTPVVTIESGGTHTGGTTIDIARIVSDAGGQRASTVGGQLADERGVAPGVYYYVIENIDGATATGVFSAFWEERP